MEDLRDVGQKALNSINRLGASDVGDLVLGISQIVDDLQDPPDRESLTPELRKLKLEHLRGLFRELVHGEKYEDVTPIAAKVNDWDIGAMSGVLNNFPYAIGSGISLSSSTYTFQTSNKPTESFYIDDKNNIGIRTEPGEPGIAPKIEMDAMPIIEMDAMPIVEKPFVPRWWKSQVTQTQLEEEFTDDDIN